LNEVNRKCEFVCEDFKARGREGCGEVGGEQCYLNVGTDKCEFNCSEYTKEAIIDGEGFCEVILCE
jgi:hypothetical protein